MQELLYARLGSQTISNTVTGTSFTWPKLVEGSDLVLGFRFLQRSGTGVQEVQRNVRAWQAVIGPLDARPTAGTIRLRFGTASPAHGVNVTASLEVATLSAASLQAAIRALSGLGSFNAVTVTEADGSYYVTGADGSALDITLAENKSFPLASLRVTSTVLVGKHVYGLRLVQVPVAFADQQARVAPPAPVVTEVVPGSAMEGNQHNAIQKITFHPSFRGLYTIGYDGKTTTTLKIGNGSTADPSDGVTQVKAALDAIADANGEFIVTNPDSGVVQIEFYGTMGKQTQALLTVAVYSAPPGDVTTTLSLKTFALWLLLNASPKGYVTLPLEVTCTLENEQDSSLLEEHVLIRTDVTILRRVGGPDFGSAPAIAWANPPLPKDYIPFNASQTGIGGFTYETVIGNGEDTVFVITHGQGSDHISNVELLENATPGRIYIPGTDFTARRINDNVVEVTVLGETPPAADAIKVIITFAQTRSQFVEGVTFEIGQVNGLALSLAGLTSDVTAIMSQLAISGVGSARTTGEQDVAMSWSLNKYAEIFGRRSRQKLTVASFTDFDTTTLPRHGGALLSAIHADSSVALPTTLIGGAVGTLYKNESGSTITIPGGKAHKGFDLAPNEYAAWSGDIWYQVAKEVSAEKTYYPVDFIRELCFIPVTSAQFRTGYELSLRFGLELATIAAEVRFHYVLVIEHGTLGSDTTPSSTGLNLGNITWSATPMLTQPIIIGPESSVGIFGVTIQRLATGIVAKRSAYGGTAAADSAPTTANFALRARLIRPDTENGKPSALGFIGLRGLDAQPTGKTTTTDETLGKCIVQQI